jgi:3-deoxy-D-manno-octulosonic-acid transferase
LAAGIILLDSVGELSSVYAVADIAIMGKSFSGFGGQNPLEPAHWGKPIICGPHMENFPFINDFFREGAAFEVETSGLGNKIAELLEKPEDAKQAGEKARKILLENAGAVEKALELAQKHIK